MLWEVLRHSAYSPDLLPHCFHIIGSLKFCQTMICRRL
jgi:hypothetical protein